MDRENTNNENEYIHLSNLTALVVSSEDGDAVLVADLQADKERHSLNRVVSTINIITHKEVVGIRGLTSDTEQLNQVVPLTVNVTADSYRGSHGLHVRLALENLTTLSL
jgi:20S proteasome alpha/beta subunit